MSSTSLQPLACSPFAVLGLAPPDVRAIVDEGYEVPTPVQRMAIPAVLDGADLLACAQTGTGKTAAFVLPLLQRLAAEPRAGRGIRALVLSPTREHAAPIGERVAANGRHLGLRHAVIYGGVSQYAQEAALRRGVDLVVATPGRLLDRPHRPRGTRGRGHLVLRRFRAPSARGHRALAAHANPGRWLRAARSGSRTPAEAVPT